MLGRHFPHLERLKTRWRAKRRKRVLEGMARQFADSAYAVDGIRNPIHRAVIGWERVTFPMATVESRLRHLDREIVELNAAADHWRPSTTGKERVDFMEELSDCAMLLIVLAGAIGADLDLAVLAKLSVCQQRAWAPPDAEGVSEHVREPE